MATSHGYQCDFIDSVSDDFYCKKCKLVARELALVNCCSESFCQACIEDTKAEGKPCPECGSTDFSLYEHKKNRKRINHLQVYCSVKERGCGWTGLLEQLDTHLDPDQDICQYVDTKCPLNCNIAISKNKIEQHVAKECVKRPFTCQHCNFKATYEEVVEHIPECKYVPLQCPNFCGVTFERDFLKDHMKICRLQEVRCEFSSVGCDEQFTREDQEEHIRQNNHKHLTLTASLAVQTKEQLLQTDEKCKENEILREKVKEQERRIGEQEKLLEEQMTARKKEMHQLQQKIEELNLLQEKMDEQKQLLKQQQKIVVNLEYKLKKVEDNFIKKEVLLSDMALGLNRRFEMKNFSTEKRKNISSDWKSPAMYTHLCGYKFCIGVDANGYGGGRGNSMRVDIVLMPGEYDKDLKWPAGIKFTLELINQTDEANVTYTMVVIWEEPVQSYDYTHFERIPYGFIEHSKIRNFLYEDTLYFCLSKVQLL